MNITAKLVLALFLLCQLNSILATACVDGKCADYFYCDDNTECTGCANHCKTCTVDKCNVCDNYYFPKDKVCETCSDKCQTCTSITDCQACDPGYYWDEKTCRAECIDNTGCNQDLNEVCDNKKCIVCDLAKCSKCDTKDICHTCDKGYYVNPAKTCTQCITHCSECTADKQCTNCDIGYYWDEKTCRAECIDNTGCNQDLNEVCDNKKCIVCDLAKCTKCDTKDICHTCDKGYYVNPAKTCTQCITHCSECTADKQCTNCDIGYYWYGDQCQGNCSKNDDCNPAKKEVCDNKQCITCTIADCLKCDTLTKCNTCDPFYFIEGTICQSCLPNCKICTDKTQCTTCGDGFYWDSSSCRKECQTNNDCNIQINEVCENKQCKKCQLDNCKICDTQAKCNKCESRFFINPQQSCTPCLDKCIDCDDAVTCKACEQNYYWNGTICKGNCKSNDDCNKDKNEVCDDSQCKVCTLGNCKICDTLTKCNTCDPNFYVVDNKCLDCMAHCKTCSDGVSCTECIDGFYWEKTQNQCRKKCDTNNDCDNSGKNEVCDENHECTVCILESCKKCNTLKTCTTCDKAFYVDGQLTCTACVKQCLECTGPQQCTTCQDKYYWEDESKTCRSECTKTLDCNNGGKNEVCVDKKCIICQLPNCSLCEENTVCAQCAPTYFKLDKLCEKCLDHCADCTSKQQCTSCDTGYYWEAPSTTCRAECKDNKGCNEAIKEVCDKNKCIICTLEKCTKCDTLAKCNTCEPHFYVFGDTCKACIDHCTTCDGDNQCTTCDKGYYWEEGTKHCRQNCAKNEDCDNEKSNEICFEEKCVLCTFKNCKQCNTQTDCKICQPSYYLLNKSCESCTHHCPECTGPDQCTNCENGYYWEQTKKICRQNCQKTADCQNFEFNEVCDLKSNKCVICDLIGCDKCAEIAECNTCKPSYFISDKICKKCQDHCASCATLDKCDTCDALYYWDDTLKVCRQECTTNAGCENEKKNEICVDKKCVICNLANCAQCQDQNSCTNCMIAYFKTDKNVCQECLQSCKVCADATSCKECYQNYHWDADKKQCIGNCKSTDDCDNSGRNEVCDDGVCKVCKLDNCKRCAKLLECTICQDTFFRQPDLTCKQCGTNCLKCTGDDQCDQCENKYYFDAPNKKCLKCIDNCAACSQANKCDKCEEKFFVDNALCTACTENCRICTGLNQCDTCSDKFWWDNNQKKCRPNCATTQDCENAKSNEVCDPLSKKCIVCPLDACKKCTDIKTCTSCEDQFFLKPDNTCSACGLHCLKCQAENQCDSCEVRYFFDNPSTKCEKCMENCVQCKDVATCQSCDPRFYLADSKCFTCLEHCSECTGPNQCSKCDTKYWWDGKQQKCRSDCAVSKDCNPETNEVCDPNSHQCVVCPLVGCKACAEINVCNECLPAFYKQDNQCSKCVENCQQCKSGNSCDQCDEKYYFEQAQFKCLKCIDNCSVCTEANKCNTCDIKYFPDINKTCKKCIDHCDTCVDDSTCQACEKLYYFDPNQKKCRNQCEGTKDCDNANKNEVCNPETKECVICPLHDCKQCQEINNCKECQPLFFKKLDNTCSKCGEDCLKCSGDNQCDECKPRYYFDDTDKKCLPCIENCAKCSLSKKCDQCDETFFVDPHQQCAKCIEHCKTCQDSTTCTVCDAEFYFDKNQKKCRPNCSTTKDCDNSGSNEVCDPESKQCVICPITGCKACSEIKICAECQQTYFKKADDICQKCIDHCTSCISGQSCDACEEKFYFNKQDIKCTQCMDKCSKCKEANICDKCDEKYYFDNTKCTNCVANCKICTGPNQCSKCDDKYYWDKNLLQCRAECTITATDCNTAKNEVCDPSSHQCIICPLNGCLQCAEIDDCSKCQDVYFKLPNKTCQECTAYCLKCTAENQCDSCQDSYYWNTGLTQCKKCIDNCSICKQADQCSQCIDKYYWDATKKTCRHQCSDKSQCDNTEFCDTDDGQCKICKVDNCGECKKTDKCKTCNSQFYLLDTGKCASCVPNCSKCTGPDQCTTCFDQYYWNPVQKQCKIKCQSKQDCPVNNFFCNPKEYQCDACLDNCSSCPSATQCDTCSLGYSVSSDKRTCIKCSDANCQDCASAYNQCTTCIATYTINELKVCTKICPDTPCLVTQFCENQLCKPCGAHCYKCDSATKCTECKPPYKIQTDGSCRQECQTQEQCNDGAEYCNLAAKNCYSCTDVLANCVSCSSDKCFNCNVGFIISTTTPLKCIQCPANCVECDTSQVCSRCTPTTHYLENKICIPFCIKNLDCTQGIKQFCNVNKKCVNCIENCSTCNNENECLKCDIGFHTTVNKKCEKCSVENCSECDVDNTCKDCSGGFYLNNDQKCQKKCGKAEECSQAIEYFCNVDLGTCVSCITNCAKCSKLLKCEYCKVGYSLSIQDPQDTCQKCTVTNCYKCVNKDVCDGCEQGYYLKDKKCIETCETSQSCSLGQICYQKQCISCIQNCKDCQDPFSCSTCMEDYTYDSNSKKCIKQCKVNEDCVDSYCLGTKCVPCIQKCHYCYDATTCQSDGCFLGYNYDANYKKCMYSCANNICALGTYCNVQKTCLPCAEKCKQCSVYNYCEACEEGYVWNQDQVQCVLKCSPETPCKEGYYCSSSLCIACAENCQECESIQVCKQCKVDFVQELGDPKRKCLKKCSAATKCPAGTYCSNEKCYPCLKDCESCQNANLCEKCYDGFLMNDKNNYCFSKCSSSAQCQVTNAEYCNSQYCDNCQDNCLTCTSGTDCTKCIDNYKFDKTNKICAKQCTTKKDCCADGTENCPQFCNFLPDDNKNQYCQPCPLNCQSCTNGVQCDTCIDKYVAINKVCKLRCATNNDCTSTSDTGLYCKIKDDSKYCSPCIEHCTTCNDDFTCTTCQVGFGFNTVDQKCTLLCKKSNDCLSNEFCSSSESLCTKCIANCKTCYNKNICEKCQNDQVYVYNYATNKCEERCTTASCQQGQYCRETLDKDSERALQKYPLKFFVTLRQVSNSLACGDCPTNCKKCTSDGCQECMAGYKPADDTSKCILQCNEDTKPCQPGQFCLNEKCLNCQIPNCRDCVTETQCRACMDGYELFDNKCLQTCSPYRIGVSDCAVGVYCGERKSETTGLTINICTNCITNCKQCDSSYNCVACYDNYLFDDNLMECRKRCTIQTECQSNEYCSQKCLPCSSYCEKCANGNTCDECFYGYKLNPQKQCIKTCHQAEDCLDTLFCKSPDLECRNCISNCQKCDNENSCITCVDKYSTVDGKAGICYKQCQGDKNSCPSAHYCEDVTSGALVQSLCYNCLTNCQQCNSKSLCSDCQSGYYLSTGKTSCVSTCPDYQFANPNTRQCQQCSNSYNTCTSSCKKSSSCKKCLETSDPKSCTSCFYDCAQCFTDELSCTKCSIKNKWKTSKCVGGNFGMVMKSVTSLIIMIVFYFLF